MRSLKADVACINRRPPAVFPSELQQQFGMELKTLRDEICHLQDRLHVVQNTVQIPPLSANSSSFSKTAHDRNLKISTWNCRGSQNAFPYLHQLIKDASDIITINEHWLWPFQLCSLQNIHPDYDGLGVSDHRLNEHSELVRGCGGVGIIWKKSPPSLTYILIASVLFVSLSQPSCSSENSCKSSVNIICANLPSSDHSINEFNQYLNDLVSIISSHEFCGPLIILGDLNAHLNAPTNHQGDLLLEAVSNCNLCVAASSCIAKGWVTPFPVVNRKQLWFIYCSARLLVTPSLNATLMTIMI